MSLRSVFGLVALFVLGCSGCAADSGDSSLTDSSSALSAPALTKEEVANLKATIRTISFDNIKRSDNFAETKSRLTPLVNQLVADFGQRSASSKLPLVKGAWRQIFSDFAYPAMGPVAMNPEQVYQVVTDAGYYYNLGDENAFRLFPLTGVLRGKYELDGQGLRIEFTKVGFRLGHLNQRENLVGLVGKLESGQEKTFGIPGGGKAPNGPVGIGGTLKTVYVDDDLRIDVGTQSDFKDESGKVLRPGIGESYFILDRVTTPVK